MQFSEHELSLMLGWFGTAADYNDDKDEALYQKIQSILDKEEAGIDEKRLKAFMEGLDVQNIPNAMKMEPEQVKALGILMKEKYIDGLKNAVDEAFNKAMELINLSEDELKEMANNIGG